MIGTYDPLQLEPHILKFWKDSSTHAKANDKNKRGKWFYFLDGPPYTSGKVHLGTAWNKAQKDCLLRYKRMQGFRMWDRAGYDMHGLPIEHQVQAKFKIEDKDAIPKFGIQRFVEECRTFSVENMKSMNEDFIRLGVWMDFENAYTPISEESIEAIWWLIKKIHDQKRLYKGERPMTWCPSCASALAKHELEYKKLNESSIYFKFPVKHQSNTFLVIWTTTPWTIPFNQFIMANPDVEYIKAKVNGETWILAKELANHVIEEIAKKKFTEIETVKGAKLKGMEYEHPYGKELPQQAEMKKSSPKMYTVIMSSEYVDLSAGSGLVHAASGTGVGADYEVAHANNILPWSEVDDNGYFEESMGPFKGIRAKYEDFKLVEMFQDRGLLAGTEMYAHDYPHCWRCHNAAIFKTTEQWFFKIEDLKEQMVKDNKKVTWVPEAGFNAFDAWLRNLRDNSITKQRFWGTPLPVWQCNQCAHFDVLSTKKEIEKKSGLKLQDLHKPWIDEAKFSCEKCSGVMSRIPDVMDVWIDPGCASWISLNYPQSKDLFGLFPADFILEGIDQYRGWFNVLTVCSMLAFKKKSFKACYVHGFINDAQGRKMSKSLGNYILPEEIVSKYGADTLRYYMIGGTQPGVDINYNFEDMKVKNKNLNILWNLHKFVIDLAKSHRVNPRNSKIKKADLGLEEQYMLSKLQSSITYVTKALDEYRLNEVPWLIEDVFLELSRTYLQLTRDKVNTKQGATIVAYTAFTSLLSTIKLFTPVAPFICEAIYQNMQEAFDLKEESISLHPWPRPDERLQDKKLERNFGYYKEVLQAGLAAREKIQRGVRWPLQEVVVITNDSKMKKAIESLMPLIKVQLNVRAVHVAKSLPDLKYSVKANANQIGSDFAEKTPAIIAKIATESPEKILKHVEDEGSYKVTINGKSVQLKKNHLFIERDVPPIYEEAEAKSGFVYLNRELTDDLEAEGFAREIMRRVQIVRKKAGLQRSDKIHLFIKADTDLMEMLNQKKALIKAKVEASALEISEQKPGRKHTHQSKEKVKGELFEIHLSKV